MDAHGHAKRWRDLYRNLRRDQPFNLCLGRRIYDEVGFLRARLPDAHALIKTQDFSLRADSSNTSARDVAHAARTQI